MSYYSWEGSQTLAELQSKTAIAFYISLAAFFWAHIYFKLS